MLRSFLVFLMLGCSSTTDADAPPVADTEAGVDAFVDDTPVVVEDTRPEADSWIVEAPLPDVSEDTGPCIVGSIEAFPCGTCGRIERTCSASKTWGPFGPCIEKPPQCTPGSKRDGAACGKCGHKEESCTSFCEWFPGGPCVGEGECVAGTSETLTGACTAPLEVKVRACSSTCAFAPYGPCMFPKGWQKIASPPSTYGARYGHSAIWTGSAMWVFGGFVSSGPGGTFGVSYSPTTNAWTSLPNAPLGRKEHAAVWTGTEMLIYGGTATAMLGGPYNDLMSYSEAAGWTVLPKPAITGRDNVFVGWSDTAKELLVWGGRSGVTSMIDGAAYKPATKTWRMLPPPIRTFDSRTPVMLGGKLFLFSGFEGTACAPLGYCLDGEVYDPVTDKWTVIAAAPFTQRFEANAFPVGASAAIWGGRTKVTKGSSAGDGAIFNGSTWTAIPALPSTVATYARSQPYTWYTGGKIFLWGGQNPDAIESFSDGAIYDEASKSWTAMPKTGAPSARQRATLVFTGSEAILFGGATVPVGGGKLTPLDDGFIFRD
jgi:N-acetylneuraminic acid mutarotase